MAEEDASTSYPSIDPSHFDLIIIGTGLPESILAAAVSAVGKSVLHLDSNSFYGTHFSTLPLNDFTSFLQSQQEIPSTSSASVDAGDEKHIAVSLKPHSVYSDIEISPHVPLEDLEPLRKFTLDLSGPRVLFCADQSVDLMLKSGASHHVEFKSVDGSFIYKGNGEFSTVPYSKSAIFKDKKIGFSEKLRLNQFMKLVQEHFESMNATMDNVGEEKKRISDEDLESPFVEFLEKQRLQPQLKAIILYAIAMVDFDQDCPDLCKDLLKTKDGIKSLILYHSSVGSILLSKMGISKEISDNIERLIGVDGGAAGITRTRERNDGRKAGDHFRFSNALGALLYPIYGQGELPQAFCRCAAVKGSLYVLHMPVTNVLFNKESNHYGGVRLASGQDIFCKQLVIGPSFIVPSPSVLVPIPQLQQESLDNSIPREVRKQVARAVCIIKDSIGSVLSNLLVVFPPRSLHSEQVASVRVLQLGSGLAVCPPGLFVLYLSTLCDDAVQGKEALHAAVNALLSNSSSLHATVDAFLGPTPEKLGKSAVDESESVQVSMPNLLWSSMYIQKLIKGSSEAIILCPMPDGNLDYRDTLESTVELFHKMYPEEEFMPETKSSEDIEDDISD